MKFLLFLSEVTIPLIIFYIIAFGILQKVKVYESFVSGAAEGLKTVVKILPTLIGLMVAVGILRGSGFLDMLGNYLGKITDPLGFPAPLVPLAFVRMFSSSAATGLALDIFKEYGTDSRIGLYYVSIFYDGKDYKDPLYSHRRAAVNFSRYCRQRAAGLLLCGLKIAQIKKSAAA